MMMKQTLLLMVLALGMCSINVSAQTKKRTPVKKTTTTTKPATVTTTKERQVGSDGFVWYKLKKGNLYGAQDIEGKMIIPIEYTKIEYGERPPYNSSIPILCHIDEPHYFRVFSGDFIGIYTQEGKSLIPVERHYIEAFMCCCNNENTIYCYFRVAKNGGKVGLCDLQGREVISPIYDCDDGDAISKAISIGLESDLDGKFFSDRPHISAKKGNICYLFDLDGNVKWSKPCSSVPLVRSDYIWAKGVSYPHILFSPSTKYDYTDYLGLGSERSHSYSSSSSSFSSSSSTSSSSSNSSSGTTTVVVEQHGPVQVWVACGGCSLEPGRCTYCHGSGWGYNGRLCSRCGGNGKCTICGGNGGHYDVQYR